MHIFVEMAIFNSIVNIDIRINTCYHIFIIRIRSNYMKAKELIKLLKQHGWIEISQNGSHLKLKSDGKIEIVPIHSRRYTYRYCR